MVTKIHHAAVDGASAMRFFATLADADNLRHAARAAGEPSDEERRTCRRCHSCCAAPCAIISARPCVSPRRSCARRRACIVRRRTAVARREEPKHPVPATRFNVDVSPHKMFDAREFDLADLKTIRTLQVGVTINDVVLAICAGALRRYLEHHGELPEDPLDRLGADQCAPGGQ
jgi:diacylglycerol O-acyltransferase